MRQEKDDNSLNVIEGGLNASQNILGTNLGN